MSLLAGCHHGRAEIHAHVGLSKISQVGSGSAGANAKVEHPPTNNIGMISGEQLLFGLGQPCRSRVLQDNRSPLIDRLVTFERLLHCKSAGPPWHLVDIALSVPARREDVPP